MHDDLETIDRRALDDVTGGRKTPGPVAVDPKIYEGMAQIAQAVKGAGESIAQAKLAQGQQSQQMIGQLLQQKMGAR
jgi:hypothetical protein